MAFLHASQRLKRGEDPHRIAAIGALVGVIAFSAVIFSAPLDSAHLFRAGTVLIGFGGGLFAVGMLTAAMDLATDGASGIALGAWGAVQATSLGIAIAAGGALRDIFSSLATTGQLGPALTDGGWLRCRLSRRNRSFVRHAGGTRSARLACSCPSRFE